MKLKPGDVVLFRKNSSFISKAIAFMTSSSYTHAGIIYKVNDEVVITAEAQAKGFYPIKRSIEEFNALIENRNITILRSTSPLTDIEKNIGDMIGEKYGYLSILRIFLNKITGKILFKDSANSIICSEAVARFLYSATKGLIDLTKEFNRPFDLISPDDLNQSRSLKLPNDGIPSEI